MSLSLFALVPRPFESLCAEELKAIEGATEIRTVSGGVRFKGDQTTLYATNLWLRTATRVLQVLDEFACPDAATLYSHAREIEWERWLTKTATFAVHAHGQSPALRNSMFTALKVKDALVDRFRDREGSRPSVNTTDPDVVVHVQIYPHKNEFFCSISLDSSGEALHQRNYRVATGDAPLKENLAAALLLACDYKNETFYDPFCGSGTFVIEAALMASKYAPGLLRSFGFERWQSFDAPLWSRLQHQARSLIQLPEPLCFGTDLDQRTILAARRNARFISPVAHFKPSDSAKISPPEGKEPGLLLCNPPYGLRLSSLKLHSTYKNFGEVLQKRFSGWRAAVLTTSELGQQMGLRPFQRIKLQNGELDVELFQFELG